MTSPSVDSPASSSVPQPLQGPQPLFCGACGRIEHNEALRFCLHCGAPLALDRAWLLRTNLEFVLGEVLSLIHI